MQNNKNCCPCDDDILKSIALEEMALAHILNAEGEKIQKAVAESSDIAELLSINRSVSKTIQDITMLEIVLLNKIEKACGGGCAPPKQVEKGKICLEVTCFGTKKPILNAAVKILKACVVVASGCTDMCGEYISKSLPFGIYDMVVTFCGNEHTEQIEVCKPYCNAISVCFPCCAPPVVIKCRCGSVYGSITDCAGKPLQCAHVTVATCGKIYETITDWCGNYEFCNIAVSDIIDVTARYNGCVANRKIIKECVKDIRVNFVIASW